MSAEAERYARAQSLFEVARKLDSVEREAWLSEQCGANSEERALVEELLSAFERPGSDAFSETGIGSVRAALEGVLDSSKAEEAAARWLPDRIGSYRVVRRIAEGGMGVVYEAEQDSPRRRIALKVVHPLFVTSTRLRRFRLEAELLGRLQHPGIAQIYEAGSYDLGRGEQPYFAMEYVEGLDLATCCAEGSLPVPARLELLAEVCDAIQHAHDKGVIHRDLKPDNILIDANGKPKVLDFGIARATEGSTVLTTLVTEDGDLLGTIAYMAPEQLEGNPDAITASADVYALGAIAFQLLAGRLPHDLVGLPLAAAINIAREREPERLRSLRPGLRRELDTIVGKALEKEPSRRYSSAGELASDLRAYLQNRPITARPPSRIYNAVKFARRNSALVTGFVTTLVAVLIGLATALFLRDRAEENAARARMGERRAIAGILQATEDSLERGELWSAALTFHKVERQPGDWTYSLLRRILPVITPSAYWYNQDELIYAERNNQGLSVWNLEEGHIDRRLFSGRQFKYVLYAGTQQANCMIWLATDPTELFALDCRTDRIRHRFKDPNPDALNAQLQMTIDDDGRFRDLYLNADSWVLTSEDAEEIRLPADNNAYSSFLSAPDGRVGAFQNGKEGWLSLHSLETGAELGRIDGLRKTSCIRMMFTPDGRRLLAFEGPHLVAINLERVEIVERFDYFTVGNCDGGSLSPDGRLFAVDPPPGEPVRVWDLVSRQLAYSFYVEMLPGVGHRVHFSPDGGRLLVSGSDAPSCVVDLEKGLLDTAVVGTSADPRVLEYSEHSQYVYGLAISPDGRMIASSSVVEPNLRIWDAATGTTLAVLERRPSSDASFLNYDQLLAFSEDGRRLLATIREGSASPQVFEWDLLTGVLEKLAPTDWETHYSHTARLDQFLTRLDARSPRRLGRTSELAEDGQALTIEGPYPTEIPEGKRWSEFIDRNEETGLAISPDGQLVAVATVRTARIYDRQARTVIESFPGGAYCVDWSPDGKVLAVGGTDGHIRLIDPEFETELLNFKAHEDYVFSLAWTPDGTRLVSASGDATVRVWDPRNQAVKDADLEDYAALLNPLRGLDPEELEERFFTAKDTAHRGAVIRVLLEQRQN